MVKTRFLSHGESQAWQALRAWGVFIVLCVVLNIAVPVVLGQSMNDWTYSTTKFILFSLLVYAGLFLVLPLILVKGWKTVRQPGFLLPLLLAVVAITLWHTVRGIGAVALVLLAYLHWRYDLSELGIRTHGWKGDVAAILLIGVLNLVPVLLRSGGLSFTPIEAALAGLDRLFANPASSIENLFYFGFLAERLSHKTGRWLTPPLIGLMYTAHEMTNPEYWYEGMAFALVFVGVTVTAAIYLWRRSTVAIWLGDGLGRVVSRLF